jgi:hypothetical protein
VVLHNPVQRHQVAVDVVEDFNRRGLRAHEVQRGSAGKYLYETFVGWEQRNQAICQTALAAHPLDYRCAHN